MNNLPDGVVTRVVVLAEWSNDLLLPSVVFSPLIDEECLWFVLWLLLFFECLCFFGAIILIKK